MQTYLSQGKRMISDFQQTLDHIQAIADSTAHQGRLFERLMKSYFLKDPLYRERFPEVWLWSEWAKERPDFSGTDIGIDLVARRAWERGGVLRHPVQVLCP